MQHLKVKMWVLLVVSFALIGLAVFLSAGTIQYWQGWVYLGVGAATSLLLTLYTVKDPILLENRLGTTKEQRPIQKIIVLCMLIPGIALFIVPGLDYRFGWSHVPFWLSLFGDLLIILGMWIVYLTFKENSFGSSTVKVVKKQKVISTGPYTIVRNPMYSGAIMYFIGMSLALGSYWGLIPALLTILGLVWRLSDEEKFLANNLPGYKEYCSKVRWHLIPWVF